MRLLYCTACPRGKGVSRTLRVADAFMEAFSRANPRAEILRHDVMDMGLLPVNGGTLARREKLIDARKWEDSLFAPARDFQAADAIVVAAPYWDLMFPAALKVYIEHIFIREMTFCYRDDQPAGLCRARRALFITTAGSPVGANDFGKDYLRATFAMLGIPRLDSVVAEGLDIEGADVEGILENAKRRAMAHAADFLQG